MKKKGASFFPDNEKNFCVTNCQRMVLGNIHTDAGCIAQTFFVEWVGAFIS
jgi:hypothetical protein